ncbi:AAA-like domain-containing protein [Synechococcus sp. PCC 7336]|uniref:AAA-like domain-containing protein n=1 Tax=Synechococcus sp. PCC 7336 TaxID=195250 RepID=UPI0003452C59|nr:AAA-like domain-containing protein [Synechococcus sp. PCC 7336]
MAIAHPEPMTAFNLETALSVANQVVFRANNRHLTDIETAIFKGAWNREDYDQIAAKAQYSTRYISQDVAPKLWKLLSDALGERVRKSNFKEALKRCWEREETARGDAMAIATPLSQTVRAPVKQPLVAISDCDLASLPSYPSGAVAIDSKFYVERTPIEAKIKEELGQPGALVRIKAPQEMGKTSLVLRVLASLSRQGYLSVYLNFEQADSSILSNLDRLLRWLCVNITRQLQLDSSLDTYWNEEMGSKLSSTLYLQEQILERIESPTILVLDRVSQIFEYPEVAKDFLPLIRSWYEESKRIQIWKTLKIVMIHSTEVYIPLNYHQSPFNVGLPIQLPCFNLDELQQLAQLYELDLSLAESSSLIEMLGGQPALVHAAIYHLSRGELSLPELLKTAATNHGIYHYHLQRHWVALNEQPELTHALRSILMATDPPHLEPQIFHRLSSMGLIAVDAGKPVCSCNLYKIYFESQWLNREGSA